jgi:hypothetical protein
MRMMLLLLLLTTFSCTKETSECGWTYGDYESNGLIKRYLSLRYDNLEQISLGSWDDFEELKTSDCLIINGNIEVLRVSPKSIELLINRPPIYRNEIILFELK